MSGKPTLTPLDAMIGGIAKSYRESRGLNQERIAEVLDVTVPQISYLENGKRAWSIKNIYDLAAFYNKDPVEFLGGVKLEEGDIELLETIKKRLSLQSKIDLLSNEIKSSNK